MDDVGTHKHREYQRRQEEILVEQKRIEEQAKEKKRLALLKEKEENNYAASKPVPLQVAKPEWFGDAKNQLVIPDGERTNIKV